MNLFQSIFLVSIAVLLASSTLVKAEVLDGRPVNILSGESILLLGQNNERHRVKLIGLNAEPPNRPWGGAARRHLRMLVAGKPVTVHFRHKDQGGRIIGRLVSGGLDINLRMISDGLVRHSPALQSEQERKTYAAAEQQARKAQLGLWKRHKQHRRLPGIHLPGGAIPPL